MNTIEPTTGEIVRALRDEAQFELGGKRSTILLTTIQSAIDCLESQERTIADKDAKIAALTVRAEQAERERDAAIKDTRCGGCTNCKYHHYLPTVQRHEKCKTCRDRSNYEWRGLPQDGEGERCRVEF